ncbi:hypothetical protein PoB_001518200 [Plakobranchus ocellatus]|uniref:Uncharacterized protein n=1 Tax=Plakobranchus ocellatus TaxID=259542 RepID=A0AAV3Z2C3_9GAST|nr:hypothetical protein PoB_001518200 [Plakobranchus ocellatus]
MHSKAKGKGSNNSLIRLTENRFEWRNMIASVCPSKVPKEKKKVLQRVSARVFLRTLGPSKAGVGCGGGAEKIVRCTRHGTVRTTLQTIMLDAPYQSSALLLSEKPESAVAVITFVWRTPFLF